MNQLFCIKCGHRLIEKTPDRDDKVRLVCEACGYVYYQNPKPTATAIIEKAGQVLLIQRSREPYKGDWDLIGGFVEAGETLEQALAREVKEEVGLQIKSWDYYFNWTDIYTNAADNAVSNNICIHFLVTVEAKEPVAGDDALKAAWFDWKALPPNLAAFHDVLTVIDKRKKELGIL